MWIYRRRVLQTEKYEGPGVSVQKSRDVSVAGLREKW